MAQKHERLRIVAVWLFAFGAWLTMARCGGGTTTAPSVPPTNTGPIGGTSPTGSTGPTGPITTVTFSGAGDIGWPGTDGARLTGQLLQNINGTIFTAGDNAYPNGTTEDFNKNYHPYWGMLRARTFAIPGNHEYDGGKPEPYFDYFGGQAGPRRGLGYYSYEVGDWHVIALNSALPGTVQGGFTGGSAQIEWMKQDLILNKDRPCTLAIWHHPLFSSGRSGNQQFTREAWNWLYQAGVEIVINGHDHSYERFAPQRPDGTPDPTGGIVEFVVGTGGAEPYAFVATQPNSVARLSGAPGASPGNNMFGVLKLTLTTGSYSSEFVSTRGVLDTTPTVQCHGTNIGNSIDPFSFALRR